MTATAAVAAQERAFPPETPWEETAVRAPQMVSTMLGYLEQVSVSHHATSVAAYSLALRHLAAYLTATVPDCQAVADISRAHIEGYKVALAGRRGQKGPITNTTIRHNLGMLRTFFERIIDWDWEDAPDGSRSSQATSPKPTIRPSGAVEHGQVDPGDRRLGKGATERARKAVVASLRDTIGRLTKAMPELGAHLDRSLTADIYCQYQLPPCDGTSARPP